MPLSIIIPQDAYFYTNFIEDAGINPKESEPRDVDWDSFYWSLNECSRREIIFYEEEFCGYIIHTGYVDDSLPPKNVYLSQQSSYDFLPDAYKPRDLAQPIINIGPGDSAGVKKVNTLSVSEILWQGVSGAMSDPPSRVTIWKFVLSSGSPQGETSGQIKLEATLQDPDVGLNNVVENNVKSGESPVHPMRMENLLEELNHSVLGNAPRKYELFHAPKAPRISESEISSCEKPVKKQAEPENLQDSGKTAVWDVDVATLTVATSAPLQLKLRTIKPGSCGNSLLTTLRIEAPDQLQNMASIRKYDSYTLHILGLDATFMGGQITPLGKVNLPLRCELNEVLNVTYKLVNGPGPGPEDPTSSVSNAETAKPLDIRVRVSVEKTESSSSSSSSQAETSTWRPITREIFTTWTPILEFEGTPPSPIPPSKMYAPQAVSPANLRSKSALLKPSHAKRVASSKTFNNVSASASILPRQSISLRPVSPHKSSPILSVSRGGVVRRKPQRSILSQTGAASSVTVNLAGEISPVLSGLRLTFTGNPHIEVGHTVTWKVQAVNNTARALKLVLTSGPAKKIQMPFSHLYPPSSARSLSQHTVAYSDDPQVDKGPTIYSRLQLYEQYSMYKPEKPGVVLLSNDVSLGLLDPNQVIESEFSFIAATPGTFNLNGLRVVESTTGEVVEIGRVLEVYVM